MKRTLLAALLVLPACALAQSNVVGPPIAAFMVSGGVWTPATSTSTSSPIDNAPPYELYCFNSGINKWVPADSTCFGGTGSFNTLTGDATSTATGGATTVNGIKGKTIPTLASGYLQYNGSAWVFSTPGGSGNTTSTALTTNKLPKSNGANSIVDSSVSDDGTTVTTPEAFTAGGAITAGASGGIGGTLTLPEGTAATAVAAKEIGYADSTAHCFKIANNAGSFFCVTQTIASGQTAVPVTALAANTCDASATTATATGSATTDSAAVTYASDPTALTGYGGGTAGGITITSWVTANTFNFKRCNQTASSITPGALNINWRITR